MSDVRSITRNEEGKLMLEIMQLQTVEATEQEELDLKSKYDSLATQRVTLESDIEDLTGKLADVDSSLEMLDPIFGAETADEDSEESSE